MEAKKLVEVVTAQGGPVANIEPDRLENIFSKIDTNPQMTINKDTLYKMLLDEIATDQNPPEGNQPQPQGYN